MTRKMHAKKGVHKEHHDWRKDCHQGLVIQAQRRRSCNNANYPVKESNVSRMRWMPSDRGLCTEQQGITSHNKAIVSMWIGRCFSGRWEYQFIPSPFGPETRGRSLIQAHQLKSKLQSIVHGRHLRRFNVFSFQRGPDFGVERRDTRGPCAPPIKLGRF